MKKSFAVILALIMALSMTVPAFATRYPDDSAPMSSVEGQAPIYLYGEGTNVSNAVYNKDGAAIPDWEETSTIGVNETEWNAIPANQTPIIIETVFEETQKEDSFDNVPFIEQIVTLKKSFDDKPAGEWNKNGFIIADILDDLYFNLYYAYTNLEGNPIGVDFSRHVAPGSLDINGFISFSLNIGKGWYAVVETFKPGSLADVMELFGKNQVNIEYLYASLEGQREGQSGKAVVIFRLEDHEKGLKILKENNVSMINSF